MRNGPSVAEDELGPLVEPPPCGPVAVPAPNGWEGNDGDVERDRRCRWLTGPAGMEVGSAFAP